MPLPRRQSEDSPAFQEMKHAMESLARPSADDHLSESTKARHRAELLALATSMPSSPVSENTVPGPAPVRSSQRKRVFWFASAFAVTVLVLNLVVSALPGRRGTDQGNLVARLLVPAAQSAEAFSLQPVKTTVAGIDVDQGWTLRTSVPASADAIQRALKIEPAVSVNVEKIDDRSWRVTPVQALNANTVYRVTLAASLQNGSTETPYEYSWTSQTAGAFQLEAMTPAPGAVSVPVDTAIEWTFSRAGFTNAESFIQISPAVDGRFETRDRTLVFLPTKPLKETQVYKLRLKAGFGIPGSPDSQLKEDMEYAFQVVNTDYSQQETSFYLPVKEEVGTGKTIELALSPQKGLPKVDLYRLSVDEAETYLRERSMRYGAFTWGESTQAPIDALTQGKSPVLRLDAPTISTRTAQYGGQESYLVIPSQGAGFYLVRVANVEGTVKDYSLVQVSDLAVRAMTDDTSGLFWIVNAQNRQPVSGAEVKIGTASAQSANDGLARVTLPQELVTPSALIVKTIIARVQAQGQETLVQVDPVMIPWWYGFGQSSGSNEGLRRTWSYLYVDRFVQRQADTINVFGLALDRATRQPAANLKLRLTTNDYRYRIYDGYAAQTPTLQEQPVAVDASGRYQASFSWANMQPGSYQIELLRDGKTVDTQYFAIKYEAKPRMVVTLELDRGEVFAGDMVTGRVRTTFADGTPFPSADVRLQMNQSASNAVLTDQTLTTDDLGVASFRVATNRSQECAAVPGNAYFQGDCYFSGMVNISALSTTGEEGVVGEYKSVTIHFSSIRLENTRDEYGAVSTNWNANGAIGIEAKSTQLTLTSDGFTSTPKAGQTVSADIYRVNVERVQTGTRYDEVQKKVVPITSEIRTLVLENRTSLMSDAGGNLLGSLSVNSTSSEYQLVLSVVDGQGRRAFSQTWLPARNSDQSTGPGSWPAQAEQDRFTLVRTDSTESSQDRDYRMVSLNQRVSLSLRANDVPLSVQKYSRPLFVIASRGLVTSVVSADDRFDFTFDERVYPNATVYAIVFTDKGFAQVSDSYSLNTDPFKLTVQATTDKEAYAPNTTSTVQIRVMDAQGRPVSGAKVAVSTADLMLESLGAFAYEGATPLSGIYRFVEDGLKGTASTHDAFKAMNGGAEGGGGAGEDALRNPRTNFKDQADFQVVETDANGQASASLVMPDNITTWRMELVALGKDLQAGALVIKRPASKPLAVDAVVPKVLQVGDRAELKLRPISETLSDTADVTYAVDAPTLGINKQTFKAKGRQKTYVPVTVTEAMVGEHKVRVGVLTNDHQDAMEFVVRVEARGYTKTIWEQASATDGFRLPESLAPESTVIITSSARSALIMDVQNLIGANGNSRIESLLAARMASALLPQVGAPAASDGGPAIDWNAYQENGIRPLPQSSPELVASFNAAFSGQTGIDANALAAYFRSTAAKKDVSRLDRLTAVAGLGMLRQPTLTSLQAAAAQTDLSLKEQVVLMKAFVAMGDRDDAQKLFDQWMTKAQTVDGRTFVNVDPSERTRHEVTRVALLAAGFLSDSRFASLADYVGKTSVDQPVFDPVLDARILASRVAQAPQEEASVTYRIGDQVQEANLKDGPVWVGLTGTTWNLFSIDKVQGPVTVQWSRRVPGLPTQNANLGITRTIVPVTAGQLREGDMVRITLTPTLTSRETFACYEIRDRLPANLRALVGWEFVDKGWAPAPNANGEMRFTTCNGYRDTISYTAQIVSAGTYTAPSPLLQNIEQPSLAAIGREDTVTTVRR